MYFSKNVRTYLSGLGNELDPSWRTVQCQKIIDMHSHVSYFSMTYSKKKIGIFTIGETIIKPTQVTNVGSFGEPGIYSARYAGDHDDEANKKKLLHNLEGVPFEKRTAHFHCSLVITSPVKDPLIAEGNVEGYIVEEERGKGGFGYDPLFFYPPLDKTFGETTADEKNAVSHRANAIKDLLTKFDEWWEE